MKKEDIQKRVLQHGKPLALDKFEWDEKTKTFSSREINLVLDFKNRNKCTFITLHDCIFITGYGCTFTTGRGCYFITKNLCNFKTEEACNFKTEHDCIFKTGSYCVFNTSRNCDFKAGRWCTFNVLEDCVIKAGVNSVAIRRDIFEVIQIPLGKQIQLNDYKNNGYIILN